MTTREYVVTQQHLYDVARRLEAKGLTQVAATYRHKARQLAQEQIRRDPAK